MGVGIVLILLVASAVYTFLQASRKRELSLRETGDYLPEIREVLNKIHYVDSLSVQGKRRFAQRTATLASSMKFIGKEGFDVTPKMELLISASAVQLTFGLDDYLFPMFQNVIVYPKAFYVESLGQELRGGVSPAGNIYLSWNNVLEGNDTENDGVNLGLHEMTHALILSSYHGDQAPEFLERLKQLIEKTRSVLELKPERYQQFLRRYAFTNQQEFLAVSIENFFEKPIEFKEQLPELYLELTQVLNQDPLNVDRDYRVAESIVSN